MNLFIVPSWYPSISNPSYGIFVKEQIAMMAKERPEWKIGVSIWGQGDSEKLIWIKDHLRNAQKFNKHSLDQAKVREQAGFKEYYQPALSWTKKFRKGNLKEIIRCNELNYQAYTLENGKPDAIMVQACYPGILIADYLSAKYKVSVHLHARLGGFMFENMLADLGSMEKDLLSAVSRSKLITVTSEFHKNELSKWIDKCSTLHNPVDLSFFEVGNKESDYAIAIGRLEKEKGFDLLLDSISKIPDLNLKLIGDGSEKEMLKKKIKSLNIGNRVRLLGEKDRKKIRDLIQKSQFLILPSMFETFGNVLLESMACGKPVVATKCGGPEEIVQPESGYLAEVNAEDLTEKIQQMVINHYSFKSDQVRKVVEDRFSPSQWLSNLEELFKKSL